MILIDNNLSPRLVAILNDTYEGIKHVATVALDKEEDLIIWEYATKYQLNILTKDIDFNNIQQIKGFPPKIIWIRSGNVSTKYIAQLLRDKEKAIKAFLHNESVGILEIR